MWIQVMCVEIMLCVVSHTRPFDKYCLLIKPRGELFAVIWKRTVYYLHWQLKCCAMSTPHMHNSLENQRCIKRWQLRGKRIDPFLLHPYIYSVYSSLWECKYKRILNESSPSNIPTTAHQRCIHVCATQPAGATYGIICSSVLLNNFKM